MDARSVCQREAEVTNQSRQKFIHGLQLVTDALCLFGAYFLAVWFWLDLLHHDINNMAGDNASIALIVTLAGIASLALLGTYDEHQKRFRRQVLLSAEGALFSGLLAGLLMYMSHNDHFSRGVLGSYILWGALLLSVKRFLLIQAIRHFVPPEKRLRRVLVVGTGTLARNYQRDLQTMNLDILDEKRVVAGFVGRDTTVPGYLGSFNQLDTLLENPAIDEVVVALELEDADRVRDVIRSCEHSGTRISIIPYYNDVMPAVPSIELMGSSKVINLRSIPLDNLGRAAIKRTADIVGSAVLLLVLSPLLLAVAIGTKMSSPGPIFFKQERVGRHKKPFYMLKFRSMRVNDAETTGWTTADDPRKTRFGTFIRKFSIDELPQLLNVLKGDMSLVGPRPEIPFYVEQYKDSVPLYMVKHQVRPGMTGWAQVNGLRGDTSIPLRIEHDVWYIEHWSVKLDIKILIRTALGGFINQEKKAAPSAK